MDIKTFIDTTDNSDRIQKIIELVVENSAWNVINLCNIATINREY